MKKNRKTQVRNALLLLVVACFAAYAIGTTFVHYYGGLPWRQASGVEPLPTSTPQIVADTVKPAPKATTTEQVKPASVQKPAKVDAPEKPKKTVLTTTDINPENVIALANNERIDRGLGTLTRNEKLEAAAKKKVADMVATQHFAHGNSDGGSIATYAIEEGYAYQYLGENLSESSGWDVARLHSEWMLSPSHKANILKPQYTEIGVATGIGTYQSRAVLYVAVYFANPAR